MREEVVLNLVEEVGFSQNPANGVAAARPWRLAVLKTVLTAHEGGKIDGLITWAVGEHVNRGSYWRAPWPEGFQTPEEFRGSGRWHAADGGGHYSILRDALVRAYEKTLTRSGNPELAVQALAVALNGRLLPDRWEFGKKVQYLLRAVINRLERDLAAYEAAQQAAATDAVLYEGRIGCTEFVVVREDAPNDRFYPGRFVVRVGKVYDERVRLDQVEPHLDPLRAVGLDWERTFCSQCEADDPDCGRTCTAPWRVVRTGDS